MTACEGGFSCCEGSWRTMALEDCPWRCLQFNPGAMENVGSTRQCHFFSHWKVSGFGWPREKMEGRLPMFNSLLQHSLRSLCACSDSSSPSKWVYAVFWRILPRNYPPPKWDYGGSLLDRTKGNKRNWILVWEDGFCDFVACEGASSSSVYGKARFGADLFFKMSHEVYSFGEGLVGKVASDYSHKWVHSDSKPLSEPNFISSSWNTSTDPQPKAWEAQFTSGIETIAIISVREGAIQLGSFDKVVEDLSLVLSIQRKFSYLHSMPGMYTSQRPYLPTPLMGGMSQNNESIDIKPHVSRFKRQKFEHNDEDSASRPVYSDTRGLGTLPLCSIPPLLPYNPGAFMWKINSGETLRNESGMNQNSVVDEIWGDADGGKEEKALALNQKLKSEDG